jgi:dephospho-CoA kinase
VAKYFESIGYPVLFMDIVGHEVLKKRSVFEILVKRFGVGLLDENGEIDRRKLGSIVFSDRESLKFLNETMHPVMNGMAKEWIDMQCEKEEAICFVEAAILFEMKMDTFLDKILFVDLTENKILERTFKRGRKNVEEIQRILSTQQAKAAEIDYVITNDGTLEELYEKCDAFEKNVLNALRK